MSVYRRIAERLEALGISATEASRRAGQNNDFIRDIERGKKKDIASVALYSLARVLECDAKWLATGEQNRVGTDSVQIVGYVGAGAQIYPFDDHAHGDGLEEIEIPKGMRSYSTVAVRVRGDSMLPKYRDGTVILYSHVHDGDMLHLVGEDCIVKLKDGRMFVKELHRGSVAGFFNLLSFNAPPINDVELDWAARVEWVRNF